MPEPLVIVGGGEHAFVVMDAALSRPELFTPFGFADPVPCEDLARSFGLQWLGSDEDAIRTLPPDAVLVVGIGLASTLRERVVACWAEHARRWRAVIHARATVSASAQVDPGAVVFAGAIVNARASVGAHAIVNSGAIVEHHASIGAFAHVAPGAVIGGGARIGEAATVGLGASVRDHVIVGARATIGMGSAVVSSVAAGATVIGVPARPRP